MTNFEQGVAVVHGMGEQKRNRWTGRAGGMNLAWRLPGLLLCVAMGAACGGTSTPPPTEPPIEPPPTGTSTTRLELDDRVSATLTVTSVMAIQGTYGAACLQRSGSWTLALNGYALAAGETALTVEGGNVACQLSVTTVKAGSVGAPLSYRSAAPSAHLLAASYAEHGVAFMLDGAGATLFYANFRIEPDLTFASNFLVRMVYSDDVRETDLTYVTHYDVSNGTAVIGLNQAPNATLSLTALDVSVTATNVVKSSTGTAMLTQGSVVGASYFIDLGTIPASPSYAAVDAAFQAASARSVALVGASQSIPAAAFELMGVDVTTPKVRSVVVAVTVNGVPSYQLIRITFLKPYSGVDTTAPTIVVTVPAPSATGVPLADPVTVTFSKEMAPATLTASTFTLTTGGAPVTGAVACSGATATFTPATSLAPGTSYSARITTGVTDLAGNALATASNWSFTTLPGAAGAGPARINLRTAANYELLATSGVTVGAAAEVHGDVGLTPMAAGGMTGFAMAMDAGGAFATSSIVTGKLYAANFLAPTPALLSAALADAQAAHADGAGRPTPDVINLGAGELGGQVLIPGLYHWTTAATVTTDVTLSGGPNDVWILQVGGALSMTAAMTVHLVGGAQAKNVFWVTVGAVNLGAAAHLEGVVLSGAGIAMGAGATVTGQLLATTAVTLGAGAIASLPAP